MILSWWTSGPRPACGGWGATDLNCHQLVLRTPSRPNPHSLCRPEAAWGLPETHPRSHGGVESQDGALEMRIQPQLLPALYSLCLLWLVINSEPLLSSGLSCPWLRSAQPFPCGHSEYLTEGTLLGQFTS